jgi:hypothetical protein
LYQVVLPDPGSPIVNTTYPRDDFAAVGSGGGTLNDSGCVSTTIVFSAAAGSNGTAIGSGTLFGVEIGSAAFTGAGGVIGRAGNASGYVGLRGAC